jgi:hypothetical protein
MSKPKREVDDEDAQDALCYGGKSCTVPPHDAMRPVTEDTTALEAEDADDEDDENSGY